MLGYTSITKATSEIHQFQQALSLYATSPRLEPICIARNQGLIDF